MSYWWYPSNWWSPDKVTNVKAYLLYIFFSTKGRIGPWNWFVAWLFLTIILYYFFYIIRQCFFPKIGIELTNSTGNLTI